MRQTSRPAPDATRATEAAIIASGQREVDPDAGPRGPNRSRHRGAGEPRIRALPIKLGLLQDYRLLQKSQFRRGLDTELVAKEQPESLIGVQRVRLAAGAVEGDHQLPPTALAQRILSHR
jgi:hypothetical protein